MKYLFISILFSSCAYSQHEKDTNIPIIKESVWNSTDEDDRVDADSNVIIVFERQFYDSIEIKSDSGVLLKSTVIKTNNKLDAVEEVFKFNYSQFDKTIKIKFVKQNELISIELNKEKFTFVYINRINGIYYLDYSFYKRFYY